MAKLWKGISDCQRRPGNDVVLLGGSGILVLFFRREHRSVSDQELRTICLRHYERAEPRLPIHPAGDEPAGIQLCAGQRATVHRLVPPIDGSNHDQYISYFYNNKFHHDTLHIFHKLIYFPYYY